MWIKELQTREFIILHMSQLKTPVSAKQSFILTGKCLYSVIVSKNFPHWCRLMWVKGNGSGRNVIILFTIYAILEKKVDVLKGDIEIQRCWGEKRKSLRPISKTNIQKRKSNIPCIQYRKSLAGKNKKT